MRGCRGNRGSSRRGRPVPLSARESADPLLRGSHRTLRRRPFPLSRKHHGLQRNLEWLEGRRGTAMATSVSQCEVGPVAGSFVDVKLLMCPAHWRALPAACFHAMPVEEYTSLGVQ